jgi:hypothetical protein
MNKAELLEKLNIAVKAANEAEQSVTTAQAELVSRSKTVGLLLLEAKKLHPKVADFESFLKKINGFKLSRAYDLLRLAGGRTTDEELKKETRERVRRHREKQKLSPKPQPLPAPMPPSAITTEYDLSVTVTETAEESADRRKAENAAADAASTIEAKKALFNFKEACEKWLPTLGMADLAAARSHFDFVAKRCAANRRNQSRAA